MKRLKKILILLLIIAMLLPYSSTVIAFSNEISNDLLNKKEESDNTLTNSTEKVEIENNIINDVITNDTQNEILNELVENVTNNITNEKTENVVIDENTVNENEIDNSISNTVTNTLENNITNDITDENTDIDKELIDLESEPKELRIEYQTHIQNIGWQDKVYNGMMSGTSNRSLRVEAIKLKLRGENIEGSVQYSAHIQNIGWQEPVYDGMMSGTDGRSLRLEAIKINLNGKIAEEYDIYYRVHVQNFGWLDWAKNGEESGSAGYEFRLEAIEVKLVKKGDAAPGKTENKYKVKEPTVTYSTHVQNKGWLQYVQNGQTSGTNGQSLRLEGIKIKLSNQNEVGNIEYSAHVQNRGWQEFKKNDQIAGSLGESLRLEAIKIRLTDILAEKYDIYYRVHSQNIGWLDWAKNGEEAGTVGYGFRLEAIQIVLVKKDSPAPGPTKLPFRKLYKGVILVDTPLVMQEFTSPNKDETKKSMLNLKGWAISTDDTAYLEVQIDGRKILEKIARYQRPDVNNNTFKGWEEAMKMTSKSGFEENIDISSLDEGIHTITVIQKNRYNEITCKKDVTINVKKPRYKGHMLFDKPAVNQNIVIENNKDTQFEVNGWAISEDSKATVRLYINNQLWISDVTRYNRSHNVNNNTLPNCEAEIAATKDAGFVSILTFNKDMLPGKYTIKVEQVSRYGHIIASIEREINLINNNYMYTGRIHIDSPTNNRIVIKERNDSFKIRGWAISNDSKAKVEIYINDRLFDSNACREYRADVNMNTLPNNQKELEQTALSGFTTSDLPINVLGLPSDIYTIKVRMIDRNGRIIQEASTKIRVVDKNTKGIDVSTHNGDIDWNQVVNNGFTFAILRIGYGKNSNQKDKQFENNYKKAKELGLSVGVYLYSYAMDPDGAEAEANNCLNWLNGRPIDLPVYFDLENTTAGYPQHTLSRETQTNMVIRFCDKIQSHGYKAGVYASKSWMLDHLDMSRIEDRYAIWVAHYTEGTAKVMEPSYNPIQTNYQGKYNMWQYTDNGNIGGKKFDFNIFYY